MHDSGVRLSRCVPLLLVAGCNWRQPEYVEPAFTAAPVDGIPAICSIGSADPGARALPIAHVLREPGAWVDKKVRVRGHILMIFEQGYFLYADGQRLHIRFDGNEAFDVAALAVRPTGPSACGEALVDVEGVVVVGPNSVALHVSSVRGIPDERDKSER